MAEPRYAKTISSATCEHGNIHILMHGADGEVFAVANMSLDAAVDFLEQLGAEVEAALAIAKGHVVETSAGLH